MLLRGKYVNKKALSLAVCLAISYSSTSYGLGLGEIESSSHLNQPFRAKINLLSTTVSDAKRLKIRVASPEVFSRVGIERPDYLDTISFTPTIENGKPVIMLSSNQPISQPFLNFLIEVSWPNGQLLKEYTVLLDPPILVQAGTAVAKNTVGVRAEPPQQTQEITPRVTQTNSQSATRKQTIAARKTAVPTQTGQATRKSNQTNKYRVVSGDTLTKIAKKLRRRGIRDEQMMIALFRANPTAFRKRNINNLKAGSLMRRPTADEANQLGYREARAAVYNQSQQWRNYRSKLAKNTVPQQKIKSNNKDVANVPTSAPQNTQARIEVVGSPSSGLDTKTLSASGSAKVGELERELIQAKESLAAKANANTELKSRVSELESLLRKKNRLITLKNEQLAELQAKLGMPASDNIEKNTADEGSDISQQVKNSASEGEGMIVRSGDPSEVTNPQQASTEDPSEPTSNTTNSEAEKEQQLAVVNDVSNDIPSIFDKESEDTLGQTSLQTPENLDKSVETIGSTQESTTDEDGVLGLLGSPVALGLGGSALLALLFGFLMRRKGRSAENEEYSAIDFDDPEFAPGSSLHDEKKADKNNSKDAFAGLEGDFDDLDFGDAVETRSDNDKKDATSDIDTDDDVLQEADVYIVYGLHDQAEVELKKAIEKHPNNLLYHAKLLENYQVSSNVDAFDQQANIFSKLTDDAEGNKEKLWKKITGWAKDLKSEDDLFINKSSSNVAGAVAVAAVAGGVAITAGKAFATDKQDDISDLLDGLNNPSENATNTLNDQNSINTLKTDNIDPSNPSKLDDLDLSDLGFDLNDDLDVSDKTDFNNNDDLDLDDILGKDDADDTSKMVETVSADLDDASLDDLLNDVEASSMKTTPLVDPMVEEQETELGAEFEDLLDLDLTDLNDDLSESAYNHDISNLNLELNNDNDLNKILPAGSPYTSVKDDAPESSNLLGDLDDDLSFMDLDDSDDDLKETQVSTKLDLARAYLDMGDMEGARNTLEEVMMEGNDDQKKEAEELLHQTG
jgi:pilus assembly protein FimV